MLDVNTVKLLQTENDKWQTWPLVREGAAKRQDSNFQKTTFGQTVTITPLHTDWPSVVTWLRLRLRLPLLPLNVLMTWHLINLKNIFTFTVKGPWWHLAYLPAGDDRPIITGRIECQQLRFGLTLLLSLPSALGHSRSQARRSWRVLTCTAQL
jgi:hypothetical protein